MVNSRKWFLKGLATLMVVFLAGCASQRVDWDYDTSDQARQQMAGWETYAWLTSESEEKMPYQLDGLQDRRIRAAVNQDLQSKGFSEVKPSEADFLVNYITKTKTRREENQVSASLGYGFNSWGMGMRTETQVRDYEEGSLLVDFVDPATKELVWRGRSQARIPELSTPAKRTEQINKAVNSILKGFPPTSGN